MQNTINNLQSRCADYCYPIGLGKTFEYAKENGYDAVSMTLLYSIYQKHDFIKNYCEKISNEFGIDFLYRDFRVGFLKDVLYRDFRVGFWKDVPPFLENTSFTG